MVEEVLLPFLPFLVLFLALFYLSSSLLFTLYSVDSVLCSLLRSPHQWQKQAKERRRQVKESTLLDSSSSLVVPLLAFLTHTFTFQFAAFSAFSSHRVLNKSLTPSPSFLPLASIGTFLVFLGRAKLYFPLYTLLFTLSAKKCFSCRRCPFLPSFLPSLIPLAPHCSFSIAHPPNASLQHSAFGSRHSALSICVLSLFSPLHPHRHTLHCARRGHLSLPFYFPL